MKFIAVKNKSPLSKLITWGLEEPVSHFEIAFDDKLVFSSNLLGVHLDWLPTVQFHAEVYFELEFKLPLEKEEEIYQAIITRFNGKQYDLKLFCYFAWRAFLWKFFYKPIPKHSPWNDKDAFLCTEIIQCIPKEYLPENFNPDEYGMVSPWALFTALKDAIEAKAKK